MSEQRKRNSPSKGYEMVIILCALFAVMTFVTFLSLGGDGSASLSGETTGTTETTDTTPTGPYIVATASVGVTGDILPHGPVIKAAQYAAGGGDNYDFTGMFTYIKPYFERYDYMVANFETTLGGPAAGDYKGYPDFNCPDSMIDALKGAGVDMMLNANNHTYDTGEDGFFRTMKVMKQKGMEFLGTVEKAYDGFWTIKEINGIKIGMACYTFDSGYDEDGNKVLNGRHTMNETTSNLISSFHYSILPTFYANVGSDIQSMLADGADFTIIYMHWGTENEMAPNANQAAIAQELCNLGADVIVGGHPHMIQAFETLNSASGQTTYCLYSTGNALSNQRRDTLTSANAEYTEDGLIFGVEFVRWDDGHTEISDVHVLPFWVDKQSFSDGHDTYTIVPLDTEAENWDNFGVKIQSRLAESYNRTMSLVGKGLNACRKFLGLEEQALSIPTE